MNRGYLEALVETGRVIPLKQTGRSCGSCQLCCTLVPVLELNKGQNRRCHHQSFTKCCKIYGSPLMPGSCKEWSCAWLVGDHTDDLPRPDRCGVVIDALMDLGRLEMPGKPPRHFLSIQLWQKPNRFIAWRAPPIEAYIRKMRDLGYGAMLRVGPTEAYSIFEGPSGLVLKAAQLRPREEFCWGVEIEKDETWDR